MRITIIDRNTNQEVTMLNRRSVINNILSPYKNDFMLISNAYMDILERYKDEPLVLYEITERDREKLAENPDYINDIPKWYIKGFDKEVSASRFDNLVCNEFWERWELRDIKLFKWINSYTKEYTIIYS